LVDALVLGTSALCMGVRVPPLAPLVVRLSYTFKNILIIQISVLADRSGQAKTL
jgi:hypothetical protein